MDQAIYHDGPVSVWLSPAGPGNVTTYDGSGPWAKIWELGAQTGNGLIKFPASGQSAFNFQIPSCTRTPSHLIHFARSGPWANRPTQPLENICSVSSKLDCTRPVPRVERSSTSRALRSWLRAQAVASSRRQSGFRRLPISQVLGETSDKCPGVRTRAMSLVS